MLVTFSFVIFSASNLLAAFSTTLLKILSVFATLVTLLTELLILLFCSSDSVLVLAILCASSLWLCAFVLAVLVCVVFSTWFAVITYSPFTKLICTCILIDPSSTSYPSGACTSVIT